MCGGEIGKAAPKIASKEHLLSYERVCVRIKTLANDLGPPNWVKTKLRGKVLLCSNNDSKITELFAAVKDIEECKYMLPRLHRFDKAAVVFTDIYKNARDGNHPINGEDIDPSLAPQITELKAFLQYFSSLGEAPQYRVSTLAPNLQLAEAN